MFKMEDADANKRGSGPRDSPDSSTPTTNNIQNAANETLKNTPDDPSKVAPAEIESLPQQDSDTTSGHESQQPDNPKRSRDVSNDYKFIPDNTKRLKKQDAGKEVSSTLTRVAIIPESYPRTLITEEYYIRIRELLFSLFENARPYPDLALNKISGGIVHLTCRNKYSIKWLLNNMNGVKIKELILKVIESKYLPKPVKVIWSSINMGEIELDRILQLMQRMNPGLNTDLWRIVDTLVRGLQVKRKVFMDPASVEFIRKKGFCVNAGLEDNYFMIYEDKKQVQPNA